MEVHLEPITQALDQHGPWRFQDTRLHQDQRLQTATIPGLNDRLRQISRASRADCHLSARASDVAVSVSKPLRPMLQDSANPALSTPAPTAVTTTDKTARSLFPATPHLVFTRTIPSEELLLRFPLRELSAHHRPHLKRPRPTSDVDGHNTASVGCKKRRLLRHLITSRLSQPFSLPATHILNREAVATGDKRFKLTAMMAARKLNSPVMPPPPPPPPPQQQQPNPSTWLRRAAVLNSLRLRAGAETAARAKTQAAHPVAVFQQQPPGHGAAGAGGRYFVDPAGARQHAVPPPAAAISRGSDAPPQASPGPGPGGGAAALPCLRIPSPQLRPLRSPELRVTRPPVPLEDLQDLDAADDDEEEGMAFPTSAHESRYGDEPEEVYADFSVIFGGGGDGDADDDEGGPSGGDHFEDYMDDLDGIPWC
ncbi:hypothetical protein BT67DRAFT_152109 [Trichocladium antarcticum]|uniref:Uncharacterized protein n=1 Tax=Trichocladium antarcticum TaxID=1450529 RepID=A0AAN6UEG1_9PEZI|nr:hypothetical protein BT67DRAFT_152109 [Trichocladium antarcticum]